MLSLTFLMVMPVYNHVIYSSWLCVFSIPQCTTLWHGKDTQPTIQHGYKLYHIYLENTQKEQNKTK